MKKFILALVLALLASVSAQAQQPQARFVYTNSAIGASPGVLEIGSGVQFHQLTWNVSGSVPTCQVQLDQSADNLTWSSQIIAAQTCTSNGLSAVSTATTANYVRINIVTKSGAGTVTVTYLGYTSNPGGGGGSIGGTIAATQVAFGSAANTIAGDPNLTWDNTVSHLDVFCDPTTEMDGCANVANSGTIGAATASQFAFQSNSFITLNSPNTNASQFTSYFGGISGLGSGTFSGNLVGVDGSALYSGTGTVANLIGVAAAPGSNSGGGTVTNNYGIYGGDQHGVGGTLNAAFFAPNQGTGTKDFAYYSAGGKSQLDKLNVASFTPTGTIYAASPKYNLPATGYKYCLASWTNTSQIVTIDATEFPFAANMVGWLVFGVPFKCQGTLGNAGVANTIPVGTITSVDSATQIHVSLAATGTCTSGAGNSCQLVIAPADSAAALNSAWADTLATGTCGTLVLPQGLYWVSTAITVAETRCGIGGSSVNSSTTFDGASVIGQGMSSTILVPPPSFDGASCVTPSNACFFGNSSSNGIQLEKFTIYGAGFGTVLNGAGKIGINLLYTSTIRDVSISYWGNSGSNTFIGLQTQAGVGTNVTVTNFLNYNGGGTPCKFLTYTTVVNSTCFSFLSTVILPGAATSVTSTGSFFGSGSGGSFAVIGPTQAGSRWISTGDQFICGSGRICIEAGGGLTSLNGAIVGGGASAITMSNGGAAGHASVQNSNLTGLTNAITGGVAGSTYSDQCGNVYSGALVMTNIQSIMNCSVASDTQLALAAGQTAKTVFTVGVNTALFRAHLSVECTTTSAGATVTPSILYTDTSGTAQTITGTAATCTALNAGSNTSQDVTFRAKNATTIQYQTVIANTPTYDVSVMVEQLSLN